MLGFIALSMIAFSTCSFTLMVHSVTYSLGVSEGDTQSYNVVVNDNNDGGGVTGDIITVTIIKIEVHHPTEDGWSITIDPGNDDPGVTLLPNKSESEPVFPSFFCPISVVDYLATAKTGQDKIDPTLVAVSGNTWKLDVSNTKYDVISTNSWETTYDSTSGGATDFKAYKDGTLVTHITVASGITGYDFPILLGLAAISTIGIILLKKKRM